MKKRKMLIFGTLFLLGCSNMYTFISETPKIHDLTEEELKLVQFYISTPVSLVLEEDNSKSVVTSDKKIGMEKEVYEKDILIDKNTPGILKDFSEDSSEIIIRFADDIEIGFKPESDFSKAPYIFYSFNGQKAGNNTEVEFRGIKWNLKFGKTIDSFNARRRFVSYEMPMLLYEFTSKLKEKHESEKVKGMKL